MAIAAVVALVPAVLLGAHRLLDGSDSPGRTGGATEPAIPPVTTPGVSPSTGAPASPSTPATPAAPTSDAPTGLARVPAAVPRRLTAGTLLDVGFDDAVTPTGGRFVAGSTAEAARWESRGQPGSPGSDTVVLIGKVYTGSTAAFDGLPSVQVGARITVRTDEGVLTYTVQSASDRAEAGLISTPELADKVPGRLVLVGILFDSTDDQRTGKYRVVVAQLSAARKG